MKKNWKKVIAIAAVALLSLTMIACQSAGTCELDDCDRIQVTIDNTLQDYCFNCIRDLNLTVR